MKNRMLILTTFFLMLLCACGKSNSVNLNDYVKATYSGADGEGKADWEFDAPRFEKDCANKVKINKNASKDGEISTIVTQLSGTALAEYIFFSYINMDITPNDYLSNGDTVEYKWDCDDDLVEKAFGLKLKHTDFTETVSGLNGTSNANTEFEIESSNETSLREIDPFEALEVKFDGIDGYGSASINSSHYSELKYDIQPASGLSNGETVIVSISESDPFFGEHYMSPATLTKEFVVEGLQSYNISESMLDEAFKANLLQWGKRAAIEEFVDGPDLRLEDLGYISESDVYWTYNREYDEDNAVVKGIIVANGKDADSADKNIIYALIELPYKISVASNIIDKDSPDVGKELGEGRINICVVFENCLIEDGTISFGDSADKEVVKDFMDVEAMFNEVKVNYDLVKEEEY